MKNNCWRKKLRLFLIYIIVTPVEIIFSILRFIAASVGLVGVVGSAPAVGFGIYYLVKRSSEANAETKKKLFKRGVWLIILPGLLIIGALILIMLLSFMQTILTN